MTICPVPELHRIRGADIAHGGTIALRRGKRHALIGEPDVNDHGASKLGETARSTADP